MKKRTVIFDFDGTIADTFTVAVEIAEVIVNRKDSISKEQIQSLKHQSMLEVAHSLHISLWRLPILLSRGRGMMQKRMSEVSIFPDIAKTIRQLHEEGHSLMILSSNSRRNIRMFLHQHQLDEYFSSVEGGVGFFNKGAALRRTIRRHKLATDAVVYVGDEVRDIDAANAANVRIVCVEWGYNAADRLRQHKPWAIIGQPIELLGIVKRPQ